MNFKITFPGGYNVVNFINSNIDVNITLPTGKVYFATFFTILNVEYLLECGNDEYFWAADMLIVRNLEKATIRSSVSKIIEEHYQDVVFSEIGSVESIFELKSYDDILDMC